MANAEEAPTAVAGSCRWPSALRWSWIPTSADGIVAAEKRLLSLVKTGYVQEKVNIGFAPTGSKARWFRSSEEPRFINTVTFGSSKENAPTLVMVHGYGASHGLFFRNYDALASRFRVIAIDQLGWGGSSRPDFICKSIEDSFEEWRKAKNLNNFILLGHSLGGYVAAKYALQHPEHVQHLILVGPAGFSPEVDDSAERLAKFRGTWKGMLVNHLWESNFTPSKILSTSPPPGHVRDSNIVNSDLLVLDYLAARSCFAAAAINGNNALVLHNGPLPSAVYSYWANNPFPSSSMLPRAF
uniref:AB hydrolase-1 domain-containing protein n=1 Tax=Aegilops tauschii TaxID=37682 RepID=M8BWY1_AEGTA